MLSDKPTSFGLADQARDHASRRYRIALAVILSGMLVGAALLFSSSARVGTNEVGVGEPAPTLELVRLSQDGELHFQTELDPNCVSLIHFWGTWCGPCRQEYPHLDALVRELRQQGSLDFLSISCESGNETMLGLTMKTHDYLRSIDAATVAFADPNGTTRKSLVKRLRQESLLYPTTVLIDQRGVIRGVWQGYDPDGLDQMRTTINDLLATR